MEPVEINPQLYKDQAEKLRKLTLKKRAIIQGYIKSLELKEIEKIKKQLQDLSNS